VTPESLSLNLIIVLGALAPDFSQLVD